jgi:hypothetical protein
MNYIYDIKAPCGLFLGGDYRATDIANFLKMNSPIQPLDG